MSDTTHQPAEPSDAQMEADLRAQGAAYDRGELPDTPTPEPGQQATPEAGNTQRSNAPAAPETQKQATTPTNPEPPKPTDAQTPYQKKRSDAQRLDDSWKKLNDEKSKFAAEREAFYREQAKLAAPRPTEKPKPETDANPIGQYTAEQLEAAAETLDRDGKFELAEIARQEARRKREQGPEDNRQPQPAAPSQNESQQKAALAEWQANLAAAEKQYPELTEPTGTMRAEVGQILNQYPMLRTYPQGITHAVELNRLQREAMAAGELRKEVESLKAKLTAAEARTLPTVGNPESGLRPVSIADMSDTDAEREIRALAAQHDAAA